MEFPNPKLQIPSNAQAPIRKEEELRANLRFSANVEADISFLVPKLLFGNALVGETLFRIPWIWVFELYLGWELGIWDFPRVCSCSCSCSKRKQIDHEQEHEHDYDGNIAGGD